MPQSPVMVPFQPFGEFDAHLLPPVLEMAFMRSDPHGFWQAEVCLPRLDMHFPNLSPTISSRPLGDFGCVVYRANFPIKLVISGPPSNLNTSVDAHLHNIGPVLEHNVGPCLPTLQQAIARGLMELGEADGDITQLWTFQDWGHFYELAFSLMNPHFSDEQAQEFLHLWQNAITQHRPQNTRHGKIGSVPAMVLPAFHNQVVLPNMAAIAAARSHYLPSLRRS